MEEENVRVIRAFFFGVVTKTMLPFFGAMVAAVMVITYVPSTSLWLPVQSKQLKKADVEKCGFMKGQDNRKKEREKNQPDKPCARSVGLWNLSGSLLSE